MNDWTAGRLDSRRRVTVMTGFPAIGRYFAQVVNFALDAFESLDQQFTPRGQFSIWGFTQNSTAAFAVEIKISGSKGKRYNRSVVGANQGGVGGRPFLLPDLLVCQPTDDVVVTATDLSGAANNVSFLLIGALNG
jgi:hypothetical protein